MNGGKHMNDWQLLYEATSDVAPTALLTVARLRQALAAGAVTEDEVAKALADGAGGIGELLEAAGETEETDTEELIESMNDGFDQFGRLV